MSEVGILIDKVITLASQYGVARGGANIAKSIGSPCDERWRQLDELAKATNAKLEAAVHELKARIAA